MVLNHRQDNEFIENNVCKNRTDIIYLLLFQVYYLLQNGRRLKLFNKQEKRDTKWRSSSLWSRNRNVLRTKNIKFNAASSLVHFSTNKPNAQKQPQLIIVVLVTFAVFFLLSTNVRTDTSPLEYREKIISFVQIWFTDRL